MNGWFIAGILVALFGAAIRWRIDSDILNYWTGLTIANAAMVIGLILVVVGAART